MPYSVWWEFRIKHRNQRVDRVGIHCASGPDMYKNASQSSEFALSSIFSEEDLREVLNSAACTMAFQPIREIGTGKFFGYEALFRGVEGIVLPEPELVFKRGYLREELLLKLDMCCIGSALSAGRHLAQQTRLFVNIHAATLAQLALHSNAFIDLLSTLDIPPENIVFELSEQTDLRSAGDVALNIRRFTRLGAEIAIDDIGSSFSWLHHMLHIRPGYLKVDKSFITELTTSRRKQALVKSLSLMAGTMGLQLIAEGIESAEQALLLGQMGVGLAQGFFFGRPEPAHRWVAS